MVIFVFMDMFVLFFELLHELFGFKRERCERISVCYVRVWENKGHLNLCWSHIMCIWLFYYFQIPVFNLPLWVCLAPYSGTLPNNLFIYPHWFPCVSSFSDLFVCFDQELEWLGFAWVNHSCRFWIGSWGQIGSFMTRTQSV